MDTCIFCRIANGEIPSQTVYEDEDFRIFMDVNPASPGHMLIVPKAHYENLYELPEELAAKAMVLAKRMAGAAKEAFGLDGLNVIQNNGETAGQSVMHYHLHVVPRYEGVGHFTPWEGQSTDPKEIETMASKLKKQLES